MELRVLTYNIQSGRDCFGQMNIAHAYRAISDLRPDICALNEVRMRTHDTHSAEQARQLGERLNMEWAFGKAIDYNGGEYGVALLSRYPILRAETHAVPDVPEGERERRFESRAILKCVLQIGGREVCALVSHFGLSGAERERATRLALMLLREETRPCLFMGDLNMTPDDPLVKTIAASIPDTAEGAHFLTHKADRPTDKIDYIFASSEFKPLETRAYLTYASDHLPVLARLSF